MKKHINSFDYAEHILKAVQKGVLVTAKVGDKVNPMTISWGTLGIQWGKPIFTVFARECRFTKRLLDENGEFTINIPYGECDKNILAVCGTRSGRDMDKISELHLTMEAPEVISVPGIKELPLTLECRVIYKQTQDAGNMDPSYKDKYYSPDAIRAGDVHTAFYGEIVAAYIIE